MSSRFRLFATRASLTPEKTEIAVMSSLALHNLLRTKSRECFTPVDSIDFENKTGDQRRDLTSGSFFLTTLQAYSLA